MGIILIGAFNFTRDNINGNLSGEFFNNLTGVARIETATPLNPTSEFTGQYNTAWRDSDRKTATLSIRNINNTKYQLEWIDDRGGLLFEGEGIVTNEVLWGYYHK
ncbi:MAG: hypothetical protein JST86_09615 [Bacteroidetes bacterium]|nr:hypothetical protein [Bacteroidota bacterium]